MLPVNHTALASLRETAKWYTTHYSTMIEGNQLKPEEIREIIQLDEHEVKGYVEAAFLEMVDPSLQSRKSRLASKYQALLDNENLRAKTR
jgi:hypothetical protein